jgi:hypothetical protein
MFTAVNAPPPQGEPCTSSDRKGSVEEEEERRLVIRIGSKPPVVKGLGL